MLKALYIGITPTIALLIVNMNINPYKLKYKDFIIAGLIMFLGCIGLYNINENFYTRNVLRHQFFLKIKNEKYKTCKTNFERGVCLWITRYVL